MAARKLITNDSLSAEAVLGAAARIPRHVMLRAFPAETVVLDLNLGKYLSLNPAAGHFLAVLERAGSVRLALERLQEEFPEQDASTIQADLHSFCIDLADRGLIELVHDEVASPP